MLALVVMFILAIFVGFLFGSQDFRDTVTDVLIVAYDRIELIARQVERAMRQFAVAAVLISVVYLTIFSIATLAEWQWVKFGCLFLLIVSMIPVLFVFYYISELIGGVGSIAKDTGALLQRLPLVWTLEDKWFEGGYLAVGIPATILLFFVNIVYFLVSAPIIGAGGMLMAVAHATKQLSNAALWLSRLVAFILIWVDLMITFQLLDIVTGKHLFDGMTMVILFLILAVWIPLSRLGDWALGLKGIPKFTSWLPAIFALSMNVLLLLAHVSPDIANGAGRYLQAKHNVVAKYLNFAGSTQEISSVAQYRVNKPVAIFFKKKDGRFEVLKKATDENTPLLPVGQIGYLPGALSAPITDVSVPRGLTLIDIRAKTDEVAGTFTGTDETQQAWVFTDLLTIEDSTAKSEVAEKEQTSSAPSSSDSVPPSCVVSYTSGSCWFIAPPSQRCDVKIKMQPKVQISADGLTVEMDVPADMSSGVEAIDSKDPKKKFIIKSGDKYTGEVTGSVAFSSDHPCAGPNGLNGWYDPGVDSPFAKHVGGIEYFFGGLNSTSNLGATTFSGVASKEGIFTARVIGRMSDYGVGKFGGHHVKLTIQK